MAIEDKMWMAGKFRHKKKDETTLDQFNNIKQKKINDCLQLVQVSNRKINEIRYSTSETEAHISQKIAVCNVLRIQKHWFICEAKLINGMRADILCLDKFMVFEIAVTESDESLKAKRKKLEKLGLKMKVVRV